MTHPDQEKFDRVIAHLRKQGSPAFEHDSCRYRGPKGTMCAIGCLIPDELYGRHMEGVPAVPLLEAFPETAPYLPGSVLAGRLQELHDEPADGIGWADDVEGPPFHSVEFERRVQALANEFGLTYTAPGSAA